jgi:hypothetical protein
MLYQPNFCCNCGEKIERVDWKLWTSRRFCQLCELDHKLSDYVPRVAVGIGLLIGIFGLGSHLQSAQTTKIGGSDEAGRHPVTLLRRPAAANQQATNVASPQSQSSQTREENEQFTAQKREPQKTVENKTDSSAEQVYYCRAATKKGTPCSRRVKGNIRCWQHAGQPAINATESDSGREKL